MFGLGPTVNSMMPAWLGGRPKEDWQAAKAQYEAQHPTASWVANAAGGTIPYLAGGEALGPLGLGARVMGMAGIGGGGNAVNAYANGGDVPTAALQGAAIGAGGELGATALTGIGGKLASSLLNRGVKVPTSAELRAIADPQYAALRENPASMPLTEGAQFGQDVIDRLGSKWFDDTRAAKEFAGLANPPQDAVAVTAGGLEHARQNLNDIIRKNPGTTEASAARLGKQSIDDLVAAKAAVDPDWADFAAAAADARGNWRAAKGSDTITGATDKAVGRAATNLIDNSPQLIAKRAQSLLENPRLTQGLPQEVLDQVADVAHPNAARKLLSTLGAMGGHTGIGISTAVPVALIEAAQHGLTPETLGIGLGAAGLGVGSHMINTALAKGGMNSAAEALRLASPAFRDAVASGASSAPINVVPAQIASRKLASALLGRMGYPIDQGD